MFTYDDTVRVLSLAPQDMRPGQLASVVGISEQKDRRGEFLERFPLGTIYTVEFEDGSDAQVPESLLAKDKFPGEK